MAISLWLINLFSLFSCFGAFIIVAFIAVRSRRGVHWNVFAIVAMFVASYAAGILQFITQTGFTYPEMSVSYIVPSEFDVKYFLDVVLYLALYWLIPSVTHQYMQIKSRIGYLVLLPFVIAGLIVPSFLLVVNSEALMSGIEVFAILKLLIQVVLIEYALVIVVLRRSHLPRNMKKGLTIYAAVMGSTVVPLMMTEDLLVLYSIIPAYNLAEAAGFLSMTTAILIIGIYYLAVSGKKNIEPLPLLDVSRRYRLTERETEVLKELVAGARYKEIGQKFAISPETVKSHVSKVYRKLGVSAKQELKYKIRDFLS